MEGRVSFVEQVKQEAMAGGLCSECPAVSEALKDAEEADNDVPSIPGIQSLQLSPGMLSLLFVSLEMARRSRGLMAVADVKNLGSHVSDAPCPGSIEPGTSALAQAAIKNFERIMGHPPALPVVICGIKARRSKIIAENFKSEFKD